MAYVLNVCVLFHVLLCCLTLVQCKWVNSVSVERKFTRENSICQMSLAVERSFSDLKSHPTTFPSQVGPVQSRLASCLSALRAVGRNGVHPVGTSQQVPEPAPECMRGIPVTSLPPLSCSHTAPEQPVKCSHSLTLWQLKPKAGLF